MNSRRAAALAAVGLALAMGAAAAPAAGVDAGLAAWRRGDHAGAIRIWRPLAEAGDPRAEFLLGAAYDDAKGVAADYATAARWYRKAAAAGDTDADFNLARMYADGRGVPQDEAEAARLYRLAADQGNPSAQTDLGLMYAEGQGVPHDAVAAHMWLNLAASGFPAADAKDRAQAAAERDAIAADMSPAEIAEAQRRALAWTTSETGRGPHAP
jgi:hypothetical protein